MMFGRNLLKTQKTFLYGVRFNSTSSKAQSVAGWGSKLSNLTTQAGYWSKVVVEVSKQIYAKEGLAPPSLKTFETVYKKLYQDALNYSKQPQQLLSLIQGAKITKNSVVKYGAYAIQLIGLFSLGEIIGRRKVFGYPNFESHKKPEHH